MIKTQLDIQDSEPESENTQRPGGGRWRKHKLPRNVYVVHKPGKTNRPDKIKVRLTHDKVAYDLGLFPTVEAAVIARDKKVKELQELDRLTYNHKRIKLNQTLTGTPWQGL